MISFFDMEQLLGSWEFNKTLIWFNGLVRFCFCLSLIWFVMEPGYCRSFVPYNSFFFGRRLYRIIHVENSATLMDIN